MRILITKYILAILLLLIITVLDVAYFLAVDSHDAPLFTGLSMALFGLIAGGIVNWRRKNKNVS